MALGLNGRAAVDTSTRLGRRAVRALIVACYVLALIPVGLTVVRKVSIVGRADLLVEPSASALKVRYVGPSASPTGLRPGDLLLLVDGGEAASAGDPSQILATRRAQLTFLRDGQVRTVETPPVPSPWDWKYLFLFAVGTAFFLAGASALRQAPGAVAPDANFLFAAFALGAALVLILTPLPPVDGAFRIAVLVEDVARALFPALLVVLAFTFPRRARRFPWPLAFVPSVALLVAEIQLYGGPSAPGRNAADAVATLDRMQGAWMTLAALVAAARLLSLSRRTIDLLTEKQIRFLLLGTMVGLVPLCVLNLLPSIFGRSIPVLSSLSLLPLALVPVAFLAALTRYRLWDVEVLGRETAALVGAVLFAAGLFAAAQAFVAHPVLPDVPYARAALQTAAGLAVALSFVPVKRGLSAALARFQYQGELAGREELLGLVRELPSARSGLEIEALLVPRVARGLGVSVAALLPVIGDGRLSAAAVDGGPPLVLEELPAGVDARTTRLSRQTFAAAPTASVARLRRAGFRTLAPLSVPGGLLALFAIGDRDGRTPPSGEDLRLLETVLAPAGLALDHARLYDELRTQAESYRTLKEFHEDVVAGSAAALMATDADGRITSVNPAFAAFTGRSASSLVGARDTDVLPPAFLSGAPPKRVEADLGGGARVLDVAVSPFPGAAPGSRAKVFVLYDATENVRLERALADRDRLAALGTLSAGVAHEVNTPLTGVAGFARLLLDETPADDPRRGVLEKIERQAFRASRLVGSLLDLARGRPRERVPIDPVALAREAQRAFEDEIDARGVSLAVDVPAALPAIPGHAEALLQVLVNLLKNGVEAAGSATRRDGAPPAVALRARPETDRVVFVVEDNGPGLAPEDAARVFEPFYSTKTAQGGTGLGLAIARDIIQAHGGTLDAGTRPGGGARFTVSLPVTA